MRYDSQVGPAFDFDAKGNRPAMEVLLISICAWFENGYGT